MDNNALGNWKQLCNTIPASQDENAYDFTLTIGDRTIPAHKCVLAASSPYFEAMLKHDFKESRESHVVLKDMDYDIVQMVIVHLYGKKIDFDAKNALSLLEVALMMSIASLEHKSMGYLVENLNLSNCLRTFIVANELRFEEFVPAIRGFILRNFNRLEHDQIVQFSFKQMLDFVKDDELTLDSECSLYEIMRRWAILTKSEDRLANLVEHIRFPLMSTKCFERVARDPFIQSHQRCREYLKEVKRFCSSPHNKTQFRSFRNKCILRARKSPPNCFCYFESGSPTRRYDPIKDEWMDTNMATIECKNFLLTASNNAIYLATGELSRYNYHSNTFSPMPSLAPNEVMGMTTIEGYPCVIASTSIGGNSTSIQHYVPHTNEWIRYMGPPYKMEGFGLVTLDDLIYLIGGVRLDCGDRSPRRAVELFEGHYGWTCHTSVEPMKQARKSFGCTAFDGHIYVVGGHDGMGYLSCGEKYDPRKNEWQPITAMSKARAGLSLVVLDKLIYAVGGRNGCFIGQELESYDPIKNKWTKRCPMKPGSGCGAAVAIRVDSSDRYSNDSHNCLELGS